MRYNRGEQAFLGPFISRSYDHPRTHFQHPLGNDAFTRFYSAFDDEHIFIPVSKGYSSESDFVVTLDDIDHLCALLLHHGLLRNQNGVLRRIDQDRKSTRLNSSH